VEFNSGVPRNSISRRGAGKGLALLLILAGFWCGSARAGGGTARYDGEVNFGAQMLRMDDGCALLGGTVSAGSFFDDLKRIDVAGRLEYKKRGKFVTDYPDTVTTSIRIVGNQCAAALSNSPASIFEGDSYALRFQLQWKDGMELRPAALGAAPVRCVGYSSVVLPAREITIPTIACEMTVQSKGVPLVDHLIVSVLTVDGNRLTRLSAAP
jgi:hypothetical protein